MTQALPLVGRYINLDRSEERAAFMEAQFARLGLGGIRRLAAVDGERTPVPPGCPLLAGEYACFLSHAAAIESAAPDAALLVLEDDTELAEQLPQLLPKLLQGPLGDLDILFLECQPHLSLAHASGLWDTASHLLVTERDGRRRALGVELVDARTYYQWSGAAYVVTPTGRERLMRLLQGWLAQPPQQPFDRCLEQALAQRQLRGAITVPFLATTGLQWHGHSTIGHGARMPVPALMVQRRLLFAGPIGAALPLAQAMATQPADPVLAMFSLVLREMAAWQRNGAIQRRSTDRANPD